MAQCNIALYIVVFLILIEKKGEIKNIIDDTLNPIKSCIGKLLKLEERFDAQNEAIGSLEGRIEHLEYMEKSY